MGVVGCGFDWLELEHAQQKISSEPMKEPFEFGPFWNDCQYTHRRYNVA